jgi:hypothetical protein
MVVAPHLDGLLIALARARFRFLSAVLDGLEEATAMGRMIPHPELPLDHLGHARGSPDLPAESERFSSPGQQLRQLGQLLWSQLRRGARRWVMAQSCWATGFATAYPLAHRSFGNSQGGSNVFLFPSLFVQLRGAQASSFAPVFRKRCACFHTPFIGCSACNFRILQ